MPLIKDSDMDAFDAVLVMAGHDVTDFCIVDLEDEPIKKESHPTTGTVTVHRISTDYAKTYIAGHVSTWVTKFESDLLKGNFS